jgi:putative transposase
MTAWLATQGHLVNRKRVQRLMRLMGLVAVYQRPNTSRPAPENKVYPVSARRVVDRAGQPGLVRRHHLHPDGQRLSLPGGHHGLAKPRRANTLGADFCVEALEEALAQYCKPEIFNTDQGSQFTSTKFTGVLERGGITISMDGKGRCMDNIFVERGRSLKYEEVYLHAYATVAEAKAGIGAWLSSGGPEMRDHGSGLVR